MDAEGPKPAVSEAMDGGANVSGGNMPLSRPEDGWEPKIRTRDVRSAV